ncbi:MAG: UvrD-helicase domain-containing protein [Prosthecochloris sp.]|nr:UvrD-helicase domain-containing protein [Prosthecochloris sp.]
MTDLLQQLNDVQRQAVQTTSGPVMVLAGAGSGKTRVITYRIAYLIEHERVAPHQILALTFTNKAAREMRDRIDDLLYPGSTRGLWIGTFHSIFARLLRNYIHLIGYTSNFSIYDADDSKSLIKQVMKELGISTDSVPVNTVQGIISRAKNSFIMPAEFQRDASDYNQQKAAKVYEVYARKLRENNALDFDDLLIKPLELFDKSPELLESLQNYFRYILIDEYQDTNRAQYLVAKRLAAKHRNIFVVGDDAQSIYSWRGADITNILNFQDDYQDTAVFKLVENYRSTRTILRAANGVISRNRRQIEKELVSHRDDGEPLFLLESFNEKREADKVGEHIQSLKMLHGYDYRQMAVFYRTNAQSRVMEDVLRIHRIPYRIFGSVSFYKRKEIKDAVAYLRFIVNDQDSESLLRIINFPPRKIGQASIVKLREYADARGVSLYEAIRNAPGGGFQTRLLNALKGFVSMIEQLKMIAEEGTVYDVLSNLYELSGITSLLQAENTPESLTRYENLQELLSMARDFSDHNQGANGLNEFLNDISLATDYDETPESENYVSLMTVHAAKGLEFPVVFITGLEEKLFPLNCYEPEELEEERRLFYVALTRAEERLFLSWSKSRYHYGQPQVCMRSSFVDEIDSEIVMTEGGRSLSDAPLRQRDDGGGYAGRFNGRPAVPEAVRGRGGSAPAASSESDGLRKGVRVHHAMFGPGEVLSVQGRGEQRKARIRFRTAGEKTLMVQYAKLNIVS